MTVQPQVAIHINGRRRVVVSLEEALEYAYPPEALVFDTLRSQYQCPVPNPEVVKLTDLPLRPQVRRILGMFLAHPDQVIGAERASALLQDDISARALANAKSQITRSLDLATVGVELEAVSSRDLPGEGLSYILRRHDRCCVAILPLDSP